MRFAGYLLIFIWTFQNGLCFNLNSLNPFNYESNNSQREWNGTIWAVLVAGSNEWYNYRHQSDICHAYQVLHEHGIPDKNIIVMMYDDIAHNEENPTPGIIINKPKGRDVYKGVPKDYIGDDVTPQMFLSVLQGNRTLAKQGRKVVNSKSKDHIFVYFSDHGAPGLIAFPNDELMATDLNKAFKSMAHKKSFAKMTIYIEACESGSMFNGLLPKNINIFATTAANSTESSYACYYDELRETYLGDVYSVNWLEDSDGRTSLKKETLQQQYSIVTKETNTSHVEEFGDLSIGKLHVSQFQGTKISSNVRDENRVPITDAIASGDVPLVIAQKKLAKSRNDEERYMNHVKYEEILRSRNFLTNSIKHILREIGSDLSFESLWNQRQPLINHECYSTILKEFDNHCFDLSDHPFALRYLYVFVNMCESLDDSDDSSADIVRYWITQMTTHCTRFVKNHPFKSIV